MSSFCVYLLQCNDGTLYCGITNNLTRRIEQHNNGSGAKYTRASHRRPVQLLIAGGQMTRSEALRLECQVKKQPRQQKADFLRANTQQKEDPLMAQITCEQRSNRAEQALMTHLAACGTQYNPREEANQIRDLISDLLHLAHQSNEDVNDVISKAQWGFEAECEHAADDDDYYDDCDAPGLR